MLAFTGDTSQITVFELVLAGRCDVTTPPTSPRIRDLIRLKWIIACIFAAGAHGLIVTLIQYRQRSSGSEASGVQLGVPE